VTFNTQSSTQTNKLDFYIASYDMNGTYLGIEPLTNQILMCPTSVAAGEIISSFGTPLDIGCVLDLSLYVKTKTVFYELYMKDQDGKYVDIPIKIVNFRDSSYKNITY